MQTFNKTLPSGPATNPGSSLLFLSPEQYLQEEGPAELSVERLSTMLQVTPIGADGNTGRIKARTWFADACQFNHLIDDASIMRRTKAQSENCAHLVFVRRFVDCSVRATMDDTGLELGQGGLYLSDEEARIDCLKTPGLVQGLFIPKSLLGYVSGTHPAFIDFSKNPSTHAALQMAFDQVFDALLAQNALDRSAFYRFIACLKLAINSDEQDMDVRRRAREAMAWVIRAHIEQELQSDELNTDSLLRQFGVSRASLYRMFESVGGVREYINGRRLYGAVLDLNTTPTHRGQISRISDKWGFSSGASFNRAVRREFGVPPGRLVQPDGISNHQLIQAA